MRNDKLLNYLHLHFIVFIWGFTAVLGALISLEAIPLGLVSDAFGFDHNFRISKIQKREIEVFTENLRRFCLGWNYYRFALVNIFWSNKSLECFSDSRCTFNGSLFCFNIGATFLQKKNNNIRSFVRTDCGGWTLHNF